MDYKDIKSLVDEWEHLGRIVRTIMRAKEERRSVSIKGYYNEEYNLNYFYVEVLLDSLNKRIDEIKRELNCDEIDDWNN